MDNHKIEAPQRKTLIVMPTMARMHCALLLLGMACLAAAAPLPDQDDGDLQIVESTIRETRAAKDAVVAPANFYHTYDSGDKGDKGYTRSKEDKGKKGYQMFDSFHKKGGDSYGYEKHDSYGHGDHGSAGHYTSAASSGGHGGKSKASHKGGKSNDGQSAKYQAAYEEDHEEDDGDEGDSEEYDDGEVSEEEAKIADSGYDEEDAKNYENPTGYYYGSGDEYDF